MNEAASKATGRWLLLVNNDTEFPKNALDALKKSILNAPSNVAMIGPITNAAGNGQRLYDPQKNKENWLHLGEWLNNNPTGLYIDTYRCDFFCVAIENDTWKKLNGLDTIFGQGYYEDFDFSLRLKKIGVKQAITEDVFIYHQGSATFTGSPNQKELIKRNKKIIIKRHRNVIFQHARNCNYLIIKEYPQYSSEAISIRRDLRKKGLIMDMPKSWGKKMLWKLKIRKIKNQK